MLAQRSVLEASDRSAPIAVLAPQEDGTYVVDPGELAWELLGRAQLHVLRHTNQSYELTQAVGDRRMSCFRGALRCYLPGWTRHDDPMDHPLLLGDRVGDPVMRATFMGEIGLWWARRLKLPPSIDVRREPPPPTESEGPAKAQASVAVPAPMASMVEAAGMAAPPAGQAGGLQGQDPPESQESAGVVSVQAVTASADPTPLLQTLVGQVEGLAGLVTRLLALNAHLADEVERLRTIAAVRSSSTNGIERRLGRVEDLLGRILETTGADELPSVSAFEAAADSSTEEEGEGRLSLVEVVQSAAENHSDALVLLDSASDSAADSPYEDPERVRALLDAMARVARRRSDGTLGTSLKEAFSNLGIDYRGTISQTTSARMRQQYQFVGPAGKTVQAEEHIVLGNTYDPRRCLRIYFSSRVPQEARFVIGHVGRHFEVKSST